MITKRFAVVALLLIAAVLLAALISPPIAAAAGYPLPPDARYMVWRDAPVYDAPAGAPTGATLAPGSYPVVDYSWNAPTGAWACVQTTPGGACTWVAHWIGNDTWGMIVYTMWVIYPQ
jgi:hypothetical protein